ncbi:MAG: MBL fold metallo-hydrolase [Bacteroidales bacterium]
MKTLASSLSVLFLSCLSIFAQPGGMQIDGDEVFRNDDVVFRRLDEHTWIGSGHMASNESLYLVEGEERAVLIDAGTKIDGLDKILATLTDKPVALLLTHVHPDHVGEAKLFPELWMNPADTVGIPQMMPDYSGTIHFLEDGQVIDLGGRQLEVVFTPSHTPGSTTFLDPAAGYGFSGDSFGSGNLLLFSGTFSGLIATCEKMDAVMKEKGIDFLYPGHFFGLNKETPKRIADMTALCQDVLAGKVEGKESPNAMFGLTHIVEGEGFRINYGEAALK